MWIADQYNTKRRPDLHLGWRFLINSWKSGLFMQPALQAEVGTYNRIFDLTKILVEV